MKKRLLLIKLWLSGVTPESVSTTVTPSFSLFLVFHLYRYSYFAFSIQLTLVLRGFYLKKEKQPNMEMQILTCFSYSSVFFRAWENLLKSDKEKNYNHFNFIRQQEEQHWTAFVPFGGLFELNNRTDGKLCWWNPPHLLSMSNVLWNKNDMDVSADEIAKLVGKGLYGPEALNLCDIMDHGSKEVIVVSGGVQGSVLMGAFSSKPYLQNYWNLISPWHAGLCNF